MSFESQFSTPRADHKSPEENQSVQVNSNERINPEQTLASTNDETPRSLSENIESSDHLEDDPYELSPEENARWEALEQLEAYELSPEEGARLDDNVCRILKAYRLSIRDSIRDK